jgi:ATP-dependent DNA helicase RecG
MGSSLELLNRFASPFHRRLVFDRFLSVMLGLSAGARSRKARPARAFRFPEEFLGRITAHLPYPLTRDQESAVRDILSDLSSGRAMNRLLQGDVGCGKTLVAACAISAVTAAGHQAALMVPSQVLAAQHYEHFKGLPSAMELRPVLLTGGLKGAERRAVLKRIADGESNVVIGTHALIQEGVAFRRLSLAVIDEQHRFGVRQRALLDHKGDPLHLLVMTATPIPRTLAMTAYADLEISVIREYPRGRRPVETHLVGEDRKRWAFMEVTESLKAGGQVMVVCQLVEESEDSELKAATEMHERVSKVFSPPYRVGLIHGRLSSEEKERVMGSFREGRIHILVGTTVVEVGIDAPGAKVMVIEQPERLGLAQLHQLRGRVGRKGEGGLCLLMVSGQTPPSAMARLKAFAACQDGFRIAEMDLEMRGQGELMGLRQAGAGELDLAEVLREPELLKAAREAAEKLLIEDPDLSRPEHLPLRRMLGREPARALPA